MSDDLDYTQDDSILDLGSHREPDLEKVVEAGPDLIVNGQRFAQFHDDLAKLAPDATVLELDPRDGEDFDAELRRQTEVLGDVFGKQDEAKKLVDDFDASIERAQNAYDDSDKAMGLITSAGDIGYAAPTVGRTVGPVFDILDLDPALEVEEGSEDHQGDDVSVEAIAKSNPDLMIVLDRDASFAPEERDEGSAPAAEVLEESKRSRTFLRSRTTRSSTSPRTPTSTKASRRTPSSSTTSPTRSKRRSDDPRRGGPTSE